MTIDQVLAQLRLELEREDGIDPRIAQRLTLAAMEAVGRGFKDLTEEVRVLRADVAEIREDLNSYPSLTKYAAGLVKQRPLLAATIVLLVGIGTLGCGSLSAMVLIAEWRYQVFGGPFPELPFFIR